MNYKPFVINGTIMVVCGMIISILATTSSGGLISGLYIIMGIVLLTIGQSIKLARKEQQENAKGRCACGSGK